MKNLLTALASKAAGSALSTDVGGRIYLDEARQGAELPYVVVSIVSNVPDDCFAKDGESVLVQFSLFSDSESVTEIGTMYTDLKALYDDCSLTITGYSLVWMRRQSLVTMYEDGVRHWVVDYEIIIQES